MSQKVVKQWQRLGELDTNSNKVARDGIGARELVNVGDLDADGFVQSLPGYSKILDAPMLTDYTTGTASVSNGSKSVTLAATELVTGGTMDADTGWTFTGSPGVKWDIASGVATRVANAADTALINAFTPTAAVIYAISYTLTRSAGTLTVSCGGVSHVYSTSGTYTNYVTAANTNALTFTADATFAGTVDNVSAQVAPSVWRGDLFIGPDGKYYEVADYGGMTLTLTTAYEGATAAAGNYTIRHKVWMLAPFNSTVGQRQVVTKSKTFTDSTDGTFTGMTADSVFSTYLSSSNYAAKHCAARTGDRQVIYNSAAGQYFAEKFSTNTQMAAVSGVWIKGMNDESAAGAATFSVSIYSADGAGAPNAELYTTGTLTWATQNAKTAESKYYFPFTAPATFSALANYFLVIHAITGTTLVEYGPDQTEYGTMRTNTSKWRKGTGSWLALDPSYNMSFGFVTYPTTGKTYVTSTFDMGATPGSDPSLTINYQAGSGIGNDLFVTYGFAYPFAASADANTVTWALDRSSDGTSWSSVVTGQTALTYAITARYRYYRLTFTVTSLTGETTPKVASASISADLSTETPSDINRYEIVGCGDRVYTSIRTNAATIATTKQPNLRPASWCTYQNNFIYRAGDDFVKYWDGIAAADAYVSAMLQSSGSAGADPVQLAWTTLLHNDKIISGGNVGIQYAQSTSTALTETALTDSTAAFTTTATGMNGWRLAPDVSARPLKYAIITSNNATVATCSGASLITLGYGNVGDTYRVFRFYAKTLWYSTEAEPADNPTTNLIHFDASDGDQIQQLVSHNGNLLVICDQQVWLVSGYGPSTPWDKRMISRTGGTIAPMSVVSDSQDVYWWSDSGIVQSAGGISVPAVIDRAVRDETIGAINTTMQHNIVGRLHKGRIYWSYPAADSNVNNRTLVYDPSTRAWARYNFGMYVPVSILTETGETVLKFWEPTSGCMCKIDESVYTFAGAPQEFSFATSFIVVSAPSERAQPLYLRAVIEAEETVTISAAAAFDYSDTYSAIGTLVPLDSAVTGRTSVNATDTVYECRFASTDKGAAVSVRLTGTPTGRIKILHLDVIADAEELFTKR